MNKLYYKLFMVLFIAVAISGCKLDPPIYPEGTVANPGGGGTDAGIGLPLGPIGTVQMQIDGGPTITYNTFSSFDVALPGSPNAAGSDIGRIGIMSAKDADFFDLITESVSVGTFDIIDLGFDKYTTVTHSDGSGKGKVKISVLTVTQIQGSFNSDLADDQGVMHHVIGSFNIKK